MRYCTRLPWKERRLGPRRRPATHAPRPLRELLARRLSPVDVVRSLLERIEVDETNSFVTVTAERALAGASQAEREILAGRHRGPLHGVPVALKDIIYTRGVCTTMGSAPYSRHVPDQD